jgi:hypothetical protein
MSTRLILPALAVLVLVCTGCQQPSRTLVPRTEPFLSDVPVPLGFKYDPAHSVDYSSAGSVERFGSYVFTGKKFFVDVVDFYKEEMPPLGWKLTEDVGSAGQKKLAFEKVQYGDTGKPPARCVVTITAKGEYATGILIMRMAR